MCVCTLWHWLNNILIEDDESLQFLKRRSLGFFSDVRVQVLTILLHAYAYEYFNSGLGSRQIFSRLRLLTFFSSGSGSKEPKTPSSSSWLLVKFGKIFFFPQTSKVKLQKIPEIQYCENPSGCSNHQDRLYYICPPPPRTGELPEQGVFCSLKPEPL